MVKYSIVRLDGGQLYVQKESSVIAVDQFARGNMVRFVEETKTGSWERNPWFI